MLDTTITPLGKKLFHTWLLRPLINRQSINARLDAVQALSRGDNLEGRKQLRKELKGFKNMLTFCTKIKAGKGRWGDWQALVTVRESCRVVSLTADFDLGRSHQRDIGEHDNAYPTGRYH